MATNKPKIMESLGNQQTGYADWAKSMLMNYPFNPTFKKNGEVVEVFYNDEKVGDYDFGTGKGSLVKADANHSLSEVGSLPNYQEFDLDTLLQK